MIRRATKEDAEDIQLLYDTERNEENIIGIGYSPTDWVKYTDVQQIVLLVHESEGIIDGVLLGYDQFDWGYIETLIVRRSVRNRGLGGSLIESFSKCGEGRWIAVEVVTSPDDDEVNEFMSKRGFLQKDPALWCVKYLNT